jgi:Flp pilus assembly protein TadD
LNPENPEAQVGLGRLLATKQKPGDAVKYLRMAVQSDPLSEEAHYRLAAVCKDLQLTDEARKEFRLFQDIKQAKERMEGLYTQMNKRPPGQEDKLPDAQP